MARRPAIQNQQAAHKVAPSIVFGRVCLIVGCLLFLVATGFTIYRYAGKFMDGSFDWSKPRDAIEILLTPVVCIFMIVASIGGVSFVFDKGPFISVAAFAAFASLIVFIIYLVFDIRDLTVDWDWATFGLSLLDVELSAFVYFIGWFFAKNWLD